ncbi:hypothetical protein, partial [Photobacterium kishitanii]
MRIILFLLLSTLSFNVFAAINMVVTQNRFASAGDGFNVGDWTTDVAVKAKFKPPFTVNCYNSGCKVSNWQGVFFVAKSGTPPAPVENYCDTIQYQIDYD